MKRKMYGRKGARMKMKGGELGTEGSPTGRGNPAGKGENVNVAGPPVGRGTPAGKGTSVNSSGPPMNSSALARVRARRRKVRGPGRGAGSIRRPAKGPKIPY